MSTLSEQFTNGKWIDVKADRGFHQKYRKVVPFAAGTALLEPGTPVYRPIGSPNYVAWANGQPIHAFVVQESSVQLDATHEVRGIVLLRGQLPHREVILPAGQSQAALDAALRHLNFDRPWLGLEVDDIVEFGSELAPAFIVSGAQVFNPKMNGPTLSPDFLDSGVQVFNPTIS